MTLGIWTTTTILTYQPNVKWRNYSTIVRMQQRHPVQHHRCHRRSQQSLRKPPSRRKDPAPASNSWRRIWKAFYQKSVNWANRIIRLHLLLIRLIRLIRLILRNCRNTVTRAGRRIRNAIRWNTAASAENEDCTFEMYFTQSSINLTNPFNPAIIILMHFQSTTWLVALLVSYYFLTSSLLLLLFEIF